MSEKIVQTAGRESLGQFAPMFAHLNDDVLFGEVWNEDALSVKTKCVITVVSLMASGITDSSLAYHIPAEAKRWHGAALDAWFSHLAVEVSGKESSNEWLEPVLEEEYGSGL